MNDSDTAPIVWYLTSHGNGHTVRSCDILAAFNRLYPRVPFVIVSEMPEPFLRHRIPAPANRMRRGAFDVGVVQLDSVRGDLPATLSALSQLCDRRPALVAQEAEFLRRSGARGVVCDIPSIPLEAAARAGLPRLAVGNFSWNFIYEDYLRRDRGWQAAVELYRAGYAQADLLLRLPFHEEMNAFPRIEDFPVVAPPGRPRRAEIAARAGCPVDTCWVMLSFSSLEWSEAALDRIEQLEPYTFFTLRPLEWRRRNFRALERAEFPFADALASSDVVLSKHGFGIVSECVVNGKPLVCARRDDWAECAALDEGLRRFGRTAPLAAADLYAGRLEAALEAARAAPPPPERMPAGGAERAARRIARAVGLASDDAPREDG